MPGSFPSGINKILINSTPKTTIFNYYLLDITY